MYREPHLRELSWGAQCTRNAVRVRPCCRARRALRCTVPRVGSHRARYALRPSSRCIQPRHALLAIGRTCTGHTAQCTRNTNCRAGARGKGASRAGKTVDAIGAVLARRTPRVACVVAVGGSADWGHVALGRTSQAVRAIGARTATRRALCRTCARWTECASRRVVSGVGPGEARDTSLIVVRSTSTQSHDYHQSESRLCAIVHNGASAPQPSSCNAMVRPTPAPRSSRRRCTRCKPRLRVVNVHPRGREGRQRHRGGHCTRRHHTGHIPGSQRRWRTARQHIQRTQRRRHTASTAQRRNCYTPRWHCYFEIGRPDLSAMQNTTRWGSLAFNLFLHVKLQALTRRALGCPRAAIGPRLTIRAF